MRLRHTQDRGSGRADEVVAALAHMMGMAARVDGAEDGESAPEAAGSEPAPASRQAPAIEPTATMVESAAAVRALEVVCPVRERLWLAGELAPAKDAPAYPSAV
jgi:hypothetical protein